MRYSIILPAVFLVLYGCKNGSDNNNKNEAAQAAAPAHAAKLPDAGNRQLMNTLTAYYGLKNALVASDAVKAKEASTNLVNSAKPLADSITGWLHGGNAEMAGNVKLYLDTIAMEGKAISVTEDKTCERQRLFFGSLSNNLYLLLKAVDMKGGQIYHEYCPMAFNNTGAYWISEEAEIRNPYFGKKMLECGEVSDSL